MRQIQCHNDTRASSETRRCDVLSHVLSYAWPMVSALSLDCGPLFIHTITMAMSAGETPESLAACPRVGGRDLASLTRASVRKLGMVSKSSHEGICFDSRPLNFSTSSVWRSM